MLAQVFIFALADDLAFYVLHRISHIKDKRFPIYQWVHKWHHEFNEPVSIAVSYCHPLEMMFVNLPPTMIGTILLGPKLHMTTIMLWSFIRSYQTFEAHHGYEFPWSMLRLIPFVADATYHDYHHSTNVGNFSSFMTVWDTLLNTNLVYFRNVLGL